MYTLIVRINEEDMSDREYETFTKIRDLTLFRKGKTIESLKDAMDFWTARGYSAWIYQALDEMEESE